MATTSTNMLPNNDLFRRLLFVSGNRKGALIHDLDHGLNASRSQVLQDVVKLWRKLQEVLDSTLLTKKGVVRDDDVFICTTTSSSYEMINGGFQVPTIVPVHACAASDATDTPQISIDPSITFSLDLPVIALFSSGTTGPPKEIVTAHGASLTHVTTIVLRGIQLDILGPGSGAERIWERLRQGGVTNLAGSAGFWISLIEYFQQRLTRLSSEELEPYLDSARRLRVANCSSVIAMPSTKLWRKVIRGRPLQMTWGSTESSIGLKTSSVVDTTYLNAIGRPNPGVAIKLSEGDQGEMRVKTATMFLQYLSMMKVSTKLAIWFIGAAMTILSKDVPLPTSSAAAVPKSLSSASKQHSPDSLISPKPMYYQLQTQNRQSGRCPRALSLRAKFWSHTPTSERGPLLSTAYFPNTNCASRSYRKRGSPEEDDDEQVPRGYIVPRPDSTLTLRLEGGVEFLDALPVSTGGKIDRNALREKAVCSVQKTWDMLKTGKQVSQL
ncbi:hypothetical protein BBP40_000665 [Aspergillus hancockii]|nr:hypothetical protein BBP40_000665 [Aspergillus hancockii]